MKLLCLGSNSSGNCYLLIGATSTLVIECGMPIKEVKKALNFDLSKIVGAIVSHEHRDHAKYVSDYSAAGITVLANAMVASRLTFGKAIESGKGYKIGGFEIVPFNVKHDVPCLGFLIRHAEMGRMLFLTDTMFCEYTFPGLTHILIECNYSDEILNANIESGLVSPSMRPRLMESHMELETVKGILRANDLSAVANIVLIHLSDGNSDEQKFIKEIKGVTGLPTYAANKGFMLEL